MGRRRPEEAIRLAAGLLVILLVLATAPAVAGPAAGDTIRTNLWLARALLTELARDIQSDLPAGCRTVELAPERSDEETDLFEPILFAVLSRAGIAVYLSGERDSSATAPPADCRISYRFERLDLSYPATQRTFGLWRSWIERELAAALLYKIVTVPDGRLVASRRRVHRFADRIPAGRLSHVESAAYPFTSADAPPGGAQALLEQVVVLGTLVGLVAAYFANTGS